MGNPRASKKGNRGGGGGGGSESELHSAARSGDLQKVQSICSSNPLAINSRDKHSRTPLSLGKSEGGFLQLSLELIFDYFLDLKARLHLAAWSGHTETVNYLCKHKADVGAAAMDDAGAIHFACQKGHLEVVRTLLQNGVSVKAVTRKGFTPLHFAVQGSHLELIKYLVRKGANLGAKTKSGQTPLKLAETEEVKTVLAESEQVLKKGDGKLNRSESNETEMGSDVKEEESGAREKRKGKDIDEGSLSGSKKARVSLQHLEAEDDNDDGEEK